MQLHQLKPKTKRKKSVQVGRGGKRGKTSGRGTKGQKARAGRKLRPEIRDIIKRLPKKRGYRFKSIKGSAIALNLKDIEKAYKTGETVNTASLLEKGLVFKKDSKKSIKILAIGDLTKKITVSECLVSGKVKDKIESLGGKVN